LGRVTSFSIQGQAAVAVQSAFASQIPARCNLHVRLLLVAGAPSNRRKSLTC
jgi:hypothetical protein